MCSEQTRLSRFVIEGHEDNERPVCVYTVETVQDVAVYVTVCNECACELNYHTVHYRKVFQCESVCMCKDKRLSGEDISTL